MTTNFPHNILPSKIQGAISTIKDMSKAPIELVASCVLAAASLACQSKFMVKRNINLTSPCSLYFITIAESGERKTSVDNLVFRPVYDFEEKYHAINSDADDCQKSCEHGKRFRFIYSDTSRSAWINGMARISSSTASIEDEAGAIFTSRDKSDLALFNKIWSGSRVSYDRRGQQICISQPTCTVSWMIQPSLFNKHIDKKGEVARGIGFMARCLIAYPASTQGRRMISTIGFPTTGYDNFIARISELLEDQRAYFVPGISPDSPKKVELTFNREAQEYWNRTANEIEAGMNMGREFYDIRDYASKVAENIGRLSGIFHVFEGCEGSEISLNTVYSATQVVLWYMNEFLRIFRPNNDHEKLEKDVSQLYQWLLDFSNKRNSSFISKNEVLQYGPNAFRKKCVLEILLNHLCLNRKIRLFDYCAGFNSRGKQVIVSYIEVYSPLNFVNYTV